MRHCILIAIVLAGVAALNTGCAQRHPADGMRAIWVTRYDYKQADDVKRIVKDCADAGFNTILFQARGNATAFYNSKLEPWADELGGQNPGFDPLRIACDEAHARHVELHAWVNVMPGWKGTNPPTNPEQLYNKHPEWFWYDQKGGRQALSDFYVSVNPCLPEVRAYLVDVFREIVRGYPIDGLHLDYIRFPNEPPATPAKSGLDYSYDARTLELYKAETGKTPDEDKEAWNKWRTDQVSQTVAQIRAMMRKEKPGLLLTSAVGSIRKNGLTHYQDGVRWLNDDYVDAVILMNYTDDPADFEKRTNQWLLDRKKGVVVPGLWFGKHAGKSNEDAAWAVRTEVRLARAATGTCCVFSYGGLFDSKDSGEVVKNDEKSKSRKAVMREIVLPAIR